MSQVGLIFLPPVLDGAGGSHSIQHGYVCVCVCVRVSLSRPRKALLFPVVSRGLGFEGIIIFYQQLPPTGAVPAGGHKGSQLAQNGGFVCIRGVVKRSERSEEKGVGGEDSVVSGFGAVALNLTLLPLEGNPWGWWGSLAPTLWLLSCPAESSVLVSALGDDMSSHYPRRSQPSVHDYHSLFWEFTLGPFCHLISLLNSASGRVYTQSQCHISLGQWRLGTFRRCPYHSDPLPY